MNGEGSSNYNTRSGTYAGGPSKRQRLHASDVEHGSLISSFEHLSDQVDSADALLRLRKIASLVKPIMRKHNWKVGTLSEFLPSDQRLLGLNVNHGQKICIRIRYAHNPATFLPIEETVDTMLHELCHNVIGPHNSAFHELWEKLRDEHELLVIKGFTGENFLSKGHTLGGRGSAGMPPPHELRRLARESALVRHQAGIASGRRLGGRQVPHVHDQRRAIADAVDRRLSQNHACASDASDTAALAHELTGHTFKTKAEEDDANDRAIAEALLQLMEEEEAQLLEKSMQQPSPSGGLVWTKEHGLAQAADSGPADEAAQLEWALRESTRPSSPAQRSKQPASTDTEMSSTSLSIPKQDLATAISAASSPVPLYPAPGAPPPRAPVPSHTPQSELQSWTCETCTCINPPRYLVCDACGLDRPTRSKPSRQLGEKSAASSLQRVQRKAVLLKRPETIGWTCRRCATVMEHRYWTCAVCGVMKEDSRVDEHVL